MAAPTHHYLDLNRTEETLMRQRIRNLCHLVVTMIAAMALVPLLAQSASAAEVTVKDSVGDMWFYTDADAWAPAPGSAYGDFISTTFAHTDSRVVIRSTFVELRRTGGIDLETRIRDDEGRKYKLTFSTYPGHWEGGGQLMTTKATLDCDVDGAVDYQANIIKVGFARACLRRPKYLQFKAVGYHYLYDPANNVYSDTPQDAKSALPTLWSSRVHHGPPKSTRPGRLPSWAVASQALPCPGIALPCRLDAPRIGGIAIGSRPCPSVDETPR